ncbi:MAG: NADH-quinone oxidoreductase subunit NuoH [Proteobacteria bacterium]|nr:NADH-quinone oxidoreductase subunit NuoH [Pseudomonadota bacterium]
MFLEFILSHLLQIGLTIGILLLCVAYLTLFERKVIAAMQYRTGPALNGPFGLLQPLLDGVKLLLKEIVIPNKADKYTFILAPMITFFLALLAWAVIPMFEGGALANVNFGVMYLLAISSLGVYGVIIAGWASGSKYPFYGAIRSASQMISYEVSMGLIIVCVLMMAGTSNIEGIINAQRGLWYAIPLFPLFVIFLISILAETNRHPFDLPEAEAELVAGFNVEYSSMGFAAFFLGEYANMILMSAFTSILFLGGWLPPCQSLAFIPGFVWMAIKIVAILFFFIWVRAALPRYRFDQLMRLGWKIFLPLSLIAVVMVSTYIVFLS